MPIHADLYLDRVDLLRYFSRTDCERCGCSSCGEWLEKLRNGALRPGDCPSLDPNRLHALEVALSLDRLLPPVEVTQHPVAGLLGRQEINGPGSSAPVLVTGNSLATQEVVLSLLSTTATPFHLLFVDCQGHTVDMAMVYGTFTPEALSRALEASQLSGAVSHRELILPGLTAPLRESMEARTGWRVRIGPHCVGELPLFLGDLWARPESVPEPSAPEA